LSYKALIFDIDGTLADNFSVCVKAYQETLERHVGRPFSSEEIIGLFGKSDEGILSVYLTPERLEAVLDEYFETYERIQRSECPQPFPGLKDTIQRLRARGVAIGVVTGKSLRGSEITLRVLGLRQYIDVLEAGFAAGPNKPESLRRALCRLGLQAHEAVYVGDAAYDMEAAAAIGMPAVGAAWTATSTIRNGAGATALHIFHRIEDFHRWVDSAFAGRG